MESGPEKNNQVPNNNGNHENYGDNGGNIFSSLEVLETIGVVIFEGTGFALHEAEFHVLGFIFDFFASWCGLLVIRHRLHYSKFKRYASGFYWIFLIVALLFFSFLACRCFLKKQEQSTEILESNSESWRPPELPKDCKDVVIWFGGEGMIYKRDMLTNFSLGLEATSLPISKLPESERANLLKAPGFSPRKKDVLAKLYIENKINGKIEDFYPVLPQIVSNRLYVLIKIPFTNCQRIVMGDDMDSVLTNCLPQSPAYWDWNYSRDPNTNVFEIVNENKNPIVQVVYKSPREVLVNGVFFVGHNDVQVTFDGKLPAFFPLPNVTTNMPADMLGAVLTNQFGGNVPTNQAAPGKHQFPIYQVGFGATNLIWSLATEDVYGMFATNRKPIFKYPSNLYPGGFAPPEKGFEKPKHEPALIMAWSVLGAGCAWICLGWVFIQKRKD